MDTELYILFTRSFTVDAINQIEQFASHNLTNHHPILTTFIEAPIVLLGKHLGHLGIGLAIYLLLIFILSSYIISRGFAWMSKHHTPYAIRTIMLVYFAFILFGLHMQEL